MIATAADAKRPYHNNLVQNDRVLVVSLGKQGKVLRNPKNPDSSRNVCVLLDGQAAGRYFDILDLRLVDRGEVEDVPPIDGEPPEKLTPVLQPPDTQDGAVGALRTELARNAHALEALASQHKTLRLRNEKIEQAIKLLTARE